MKEAVNEKKRIELLQEGFHRLRTPEGIKGQLEKIEKNAREDHIEILTLRSLSKKGVENTYPDQGLIETEYDNIVYSEPSNLSNDEILKTLTLRKYFLKMFNHPYRIEKLKEVNNGKFTSPPKIRSTAIEDALLRGSALAIGDLSASIGGSERKRTSRVERYAQGPFVKLGKQARTPFVGSDSPDVWNSALAIATMAATQSVAAIPRNGVLVDKKRQAAVARNTFVLLSNLAERIVEPERRKEVLHLWQNNICGVLEASEKALSRAVLLYKEGVRVFRVYSPEPGTAPVETTKKLREQFGNEIEIFSGQIVDVAQAKKVEEAGADAIFVGIGGGGRCTTGIRSGSAIDWPELVWRLRGEINIPIIVEGGASDHIPQTLLVGGTGIGVSRIAAGGTIESPGGVLYYKNAKGYFKPYGGEASARTKFIEGKMMPFDIPSFVEGETTEAYKNYVKHALPTLTYNIHQLTEDAILAMVFRNVGTIAQLQAINPSPLKIISSFGETQKNTH